MAHRVHKTAVSSTNKHILQRDLTARDNLMQGLRFLAEQLLHSNLALDVGMFNDVYFDRKEDLAIFDFSQVSHSDKGKISIILLCNRLDVIYFYNGTCNCSPFAKARLW